jgi:hypothetical protein
MSLINKKIQTHRNIVKKSGIVHFKDKQSYVHYLK